MKSNQKFSIQFSSGEMDLQVIVNELAVKVVRKSIHDFNSGKYRAKKNVINGQVSPFLNKGITNKEIA